MNVHRAFFRQVRNDKGDLSGYSVVYNIQTGAISYKNAQ